MRKAIIPRGTQCFRDSDGVSVRFASDIEVMARIIPEDIEVTEFQYKGVWYTVDTNKVIWK